MTLWLAHPVPMDGLVGLGALVFGIEWAVKLLVLITVLEVAVLWALRWDVPPACIVVSCIMNFASSLAGFWLVGLTGGSPAADRLAWEGSWLQNPATLPNPGRCGISGCSCRSSSSAPGRS